MAPHWERWDGSRLCLKYWVVADDLIPVLMAVTYIQPQTSDQSSDGHFIRAGLDSQSVRPQVHQYNWSRVSFPSPCYF